MVVRIVLYSGVAGDEGVLSADIQRVVDLPVNVADFTSGVKQTLK